MHKVNDYSDKLLKFIASKRFFILILMLFAFQATWIAFSNNYGSPHDETYHFGVIRAYSENPNPFIEGQPTSYDSFGNIARNTSYLYHYLLSFPLKFITAISNDVAVQVIFLRLINIIFVLISLLLFRKVLDRLFKTPVVTNLSLFTVVMIPVFTYVAAGINYDNLIVLGFAAAALLTLGLIDKFSVSRLAMWVSVNALSSIVKFSYLPLFGALLIGLVSYYFINRKQKYNEVVLEVRRTKKLTLIFLAIITILTSGLFIERYVGNLIMYKTPMPDCAVVLSRDRCSSWTTWQRNEIVKDRNITKKRVNIVSYSASWVQKMQDSSFGIYRTSVTKKPLPMLAFTGWFMLALFIILFAARWKSFVTPERIIVLGAATLYVLALFYTNYTDYIELGSPIAIQGRYLIVILPILIAATVSLLYKALERKKQILSVIAIAWLLLFLNGGLITYTLRSDRTWWWKNDVVVSVNETAQDMLKHIVVNN